MNWKKVTGYLFILVGIAGIVFGTIVSSKVKDGEVKIRKSQRTINNLRNFSKINPHTEKAVKVATHPVQQKVNEGKVEAKQYKILANWLTISGSILALVGSLLLFLGYRQTRNKTK